MGGGGEHFFRTLKKESKKFFRTTISYVKVKKIFPSQILVKTCFLHQYLQYLGLETFFSHHYLYQKSFIFQIWGPPLHNL
jgi:hypothetical protein